MKLARAVMVFVACTTIVTIPNRAAADEVTPEDQWTSAVTALAVREDIPAAEANARLIAFLNPPRYVHPVALVDQWFDVASIAGWPPALWKWQSCVINRESGGKPWMRSATSDSGLMQINDVNVKFLRGKGIIASRWDLFDPYTNLVAAKALYDLSGASPWRAQRRNC